MFKKLLNPRVADLKERNAQLRAMLLKMIRRSREQDRELATLREKLALIHEEEERILESAQSAIKKIVILNSNLKNHQSTKGVIMASQFGIEELWDVIDTGLAFGVALDQSQADGWQWSDIGNFIGPLTTIPAAISGIQQVDNEALDLQENEIQELTARVIQKMPGIGSEHARKLVFAAMNTGLWLIRTAALVKNPDIEVIGGL